MSSGIDKSFRNEAYRLLIEKRSEIYTRVAALVMDIEGALQADDWERARYHLEDLRRILRTSLAFLTDEVYAELERIESICGVSAGAISTTPPQDKNELADRLQLLHVKISRSIKAPQFQDLEDIVGLDLRLKRKLKQSRENLADKIRQREVEEQSWNLEAAAREFIANKQFKKAARSLQHAIKLDPNRAVFHNDLAYVLGLTGDIDRAAGAYREAVRLNEQIPTRRSDEWMTSYFNLGIALRKVAYRDFKKNNHEAALESMNEAISSFENYLKVMPTGPKVGFTRSIIVQLSQARAKLEQQLQPETKPEVA